MMIKRIVVVMMAVGLCAAATRAGLYATGDVDPADPNTWTTSTHAFIGISGVGSVTVDADSDLSSEGAYIGCWADATGAVAISGAGSTWANSSYLYVGYQGSGMLDITEDGAVSSSVALIGDQSGSTGAVTVSGAGWTLANYLYVARYGEGALDITTGSAVWSSWGTVGCNPGSTGVVTVSGLGSTWGNSSYLWVGDEGSGTLDITDGGAVSSKTSYIGYASGSTGVATVSGTGSTWDTDSLREVGEFGSGTLRLHDGGMVSAAGADFGSGATLEIGLSGAPVESYLDVGGAAMLGGNLDVILLGGYMPTPGNWCIILDAGLLAGTFASVVFPNAQEWAIDYDRAADNVSVGLLGWSPGNFDGDTDIDTTDIDLLADAIRLGSTDFALFDISPDGTTGGADGVIDQLDLDYLVRFLVETGAGTGTEYGDFNLDGMVDITDLTRLAADYDSGDTWAKGNANRNIDLTTDNTDLTILAAYYGAGVPDAVPEPATLSLLVVGACLPVFRRKRR